MDVDDKGRFHKLAALSLYRLIYAGHSTCRFSKSSTTRSTVRSTERKPAAKKREDLQKKMDLLNEEQLRKDRMSKKGL